MNDDPHLWLEEPTDEAALNWVRQHNERTLAELDGERLQLMRAEALGVMDADDRIPAVGRRGEYLYNFWRDADHRRGVWRRTTLESYRNEAPEWDVILDVDALAAAENENWVLAGIGLIYPESTRALIRLSRGGSDAAVLREFDMTTREFVAAGFILPAARTDISWEDEDTVLVATDYGPGSMTEAGYPRIVKRWRRGTTLAEAETVYTETGDAIKVAVSVDRTPGFETTVLYRCLDAHRKECFELHGSELVRIDIPDDAVIGLHRGWLQVYPKSDWTIGDANYAAGSLLIADYAQFMAGTALLEVLFTPDDRTSLDTGTWTRDRMILITRRDVVTRIAVLSPGNWQAEPIPGVPDNTEVWVGATDDDSNEMFLYTTGFDQPARQLYGQAGGPVTLLKSAPARFDSDGIAVSQRFALSSDGTSIPYFLVTHRDADGPCPTLLYGYGAFRNSNTPGYLGVTGRLWLERGGNYAVANTRGGGEYGPTWWSQTVREGRHKVAEDFAAVARDLVVTGVTTAPQLGASGASSGGLLMGIMLTRYPDLFGALVCRQPLLDMSRFHKLLVGASWISEYGDPDDPADWEFIKPYSPYHNISAGRPYPPVLITTATSDDRVHPGHARKMTAALQAAGHRVLYYENTDGGHAGASDNAQAAFQTALMYEFLHATLGG
jgi:prolyl oligopeptidase